MRLNFDRKIIFLLITVFAALLLRILYMAQFADSPLFGIPLGADVQEYDKWAREIFSGRILWVEPQIHAPLYPFFLAALYSLFKMDYLYVRLFQSMISFLAFIPLYFILSKMRREDENRKDFIPEIFILLAALYTPLIYYQAELVSESLLLPLICLSVYFIYKAEKNIKNRDGILFFMTAGILVGLAAITHPLSLFFIFFEIVYLVAKSFGKYLGGNEAPPSPVEGFASSNPSSGPNKRCCEKLLLFKTPLIFAIAVFVIIAPVCVYNSCILGKVEFIQKNGGFNFYLGNNPDANGLCYLRPGPEWDKAHLEAGKNAAEKGISKDRLFINESFKYIAEHPFKWIKTLILKDFYVWNFREFPAGADMPEIRYFTGIQKYTAWFGGILLVLALAGLIRGISCVEFMKKYRHFLILAFSFWLAQIIFVTSGRYRLPMYPAFFIFAAYMVTVFYSRPEILKNTAILFIAALIVFVPFPSIDREKENAEAASVLGEAFAMSENNGRAMEYLQKAISGPVKWSRNYNLMGTLFMKSGSYEDAVRMFKKAVETDREDPLAYMNIAILYSEKNNREKAEAYFKKAFAKNPDSPELLYNYARFIFRNGKSSEACEMLKKCLKLDPANRKALNNIGVIYLLRGNSREAEIYLLKAHRLEPFNPDILTNLAAAYYSAGNYTEGNKYISKALEIDPNCKRALLLKGQNPAL
ncbi:MAG: hypothetical protein A2017_03460 [Lentisphaerae bacterium GWF2_44_16]|nr:MAG: hypothetical protein A2017_03460 [Lentisphaerae bacterium GWF2_44_16]